MNLLEILSLADILSFSALAIAGFVIWKLTHPPSKGMDPHPPQKEKRND